MATSLPLVRAQEHPLASVLTSSRHVLFIRLLKMNPLYLIVVPRCFSLQLHYRFYLLSAVACGPNGVATKAGRFLRPGHLRALRTEAVLNVNAGARLSEAVATHRQLSAMWRRRKRCAFVLQSLPPDEAKAALSGPSKQLMTAFSPKRRKVEEGVVGEEVEEETVSVGGVPGLAHFVAMAEDYAMLAALMEKVSFEIIFSAALCFHFQRGNRQKDIFLSSRWSVRECVTPVSSWTPLDHSLLSASSASVREAQKGKRWLRGSGRSAPPALFALSGALSGAGR